MVRVYSTSFLAFQLFSLLTSWLSGSLTFLAVSTIVAVVAVVAVVTVVIVVVVVVVGGIVATVG